MAHTGRRMHMRFLFYLVLVEGIWLAKFSATIKVCFCLVS